uniref:Uncharacterized protein n=1 Tax=Terrapene triunguis TaxID=2587831 RepID=A0A674K400_9SAUR
DSSLVLPYDIIAGTRQVVKGLEALRSENRGISQRLQEALIQGHGQEEPPGGQALQLLEEKYDLVRKSLEGIELGLGEAKMMIALSSHIGALEAEKQKLRAQVKRLCQENLWL